MRLMRSISCCSDSGPRYAELHCTTNFSFLRGGSHPDELVLKAHALGYSALAITDHSTLAGIVRAHGAAKQVGLKLLVGTAVVPVDAAPLVVWATNRTGYSNLCRLLTGGHAAGHAAGRGTGHAAGRDGSSDDAAARCRIGIGDVAAHADGLLAGVPLARLADAARAGGRSATGAAAERIQQWREVFGERLHALAEVALEGDDEDRLQWCARLAREARVPIVAAGDVRYHERSRMPLFDVLAAVRARCTVEEVRDRLLSNGERHLHDRRRIAERFARLPGAVERTVEIADRCTFSLDELRYEYPDAIVPKDRSPREHLAHLA